MRIEFILDQPQYDDCVTPLLSYARKKGLETSVSRFNSTDYLADLHVFVQDFAQICCPSPSMCVSHGLSLMKPFNFSVRADAVVIPSQVLFEVLGKTLLPGAVAYADVGYPKIDLLLLETNGRPTIGALSEVRTNLMLVHLLFISPHGRTVLDRCTSNVSIDSMKSNRCWSLTSM